MQGQAERDTQGPYRPPMLRGRAARVRAVGKCYNEGICPDDVNLGQVVEDAEGRRFVVNRDVDEIKEQWLKERTVIMIFRDEARLLSRKVKKVLIRAYEDGWYARKLFNPDIKRGRVRFEGQNVISFVAKARKVAEWLVGEGEAVLELQGKEYRTIFKPWMTKQELKNLRLQEANTNFWIIALRVQLDAYYYLKSAVTSMFGEVVHMHPPEIDPTRPKLMNVKLDMSPEAPKTLARRLGRYLPDLVGGDQGAFVQGRSIFNNIITAIEVLEVVQSENLDMAVLLIDLEKAYDKVGWPFVMATLRRMGFGAGFCKCERTGRRNPHGNPQTGYKVPVEPQGQEQRGLLCESGLGDTHIPKRSGRPGLDEPSQKKPGPTASLAQQDSYSSFQGTLGRAGGEDTDG
ncbi:hypothetical protein CBR_g30288 [Chara braunii]|uniref:Reverse transcriptase domain-containing protein n=1 Tax=Chara braunii TaxID=69332 RepID=A0A388JWZ0_CHABU|nr:hypothetical protein CBR_g30288 [Chara braunii]|eukprot:GBG62334.1 hypothetical protein CBR_g30288 [Chara braunii]